MCWCDRGGPSFDVGLRETLLGVLSPHAPLARATYTQTRGPRFETKAEIRVLAAAGDLVGMTCAHEATLARELGLPYAVICMVDNMANGLAAQEITYQEFKAGVARNLLVMEKVLADVLLWAEGVAVARRTETGAGMPVDEIISARWVVPMDGEEAVVLEDHSLVVNQGVIIDVLPTSALPSSPYVPSLHSKFPTSALLPGLINGHTHAGMTLLRGYADDTCLHTWLTEHIWPTEAAFVSPAFVAVSSELALVELIRGGVTCLNDMYWFPDVMCRLLDEVGYRAVVGLTVIDFPSAWARDSEEYFRKGDDVRAKWGDHPLIRFAVAPHAPYTVSDANLATCKKVAAAASTGGHRIHTHVHETRAEVEHSVAGEGATRHRSDFNIRPLENLHRLGMVDEQLVAVHMTQLSASDIALLAKQAAHVVHCPSSNLKLASGFCPVTDLLAAGVNVALGTDSAGSNNSLDMWREMRLAALLAKGVSHDAAAVPAYRALQMATVGGAKALGIADRVGTLVKGKEADVIAVQLDDVDLLPMFDVISHLVYVVDRSRVSDVWVRGRRLMAARRLMTVREEEVVGRVREWQVKLKEFHQGLRKAKAKEEADMPVLEAPASENVHEHSNGTVEMEAKKQRTE